MNVFKQDRESFSGPRAARADIIWTRLTEPLGRLRPNPDGTSRSIHTFGMLFAVELVYLDAVHGVVHALVYPELFRISTIRSHCANIRESASHAIYSSQPKIGDRLLICALKKSIKYHRERDDRKEPAERRKPEWRPV